MKKYLLFIFIVIFAIIPNKVFSQNCKNIIVSNPNTDWSRQPVSRYFDTCLYESIDKYIDIAAIKDSCKNKNMGYLLGLLSSRYKIIESDANDEDVTENNFNMNYSAKYYISDTTYLVFFCSFLPGFYSINSYDYILNLNAQLDYIAFCYVVDVRKNVEHLLKNCEFLKYSSLGPQIIPLKHFYPQIINNMENNILNYYGKKLIVSHPFLEKGSVSIKRLLSIISENHIIYDTLLVDDYAHEYDNLKYFQPADLCFAISNNDTSYYDVRIKYEKDLLKSKKYEGKSFKQKIKLLAEDNYFKIFMTLINIDKYKKSYNEAIKEFSSNKLNENYRVKKNRIMSIIEKYFNK